MCTNSDDSLDDRSDYDLVGAPWHRMDVCGGNSGLSLQRIQPIFGVVPPKIRVENSEPEDSWLMPLLADRNGAKLANGVVEFQSSAKNVDDMVIMPIDIHMGELGDVRHWVMGQNVAPA